MSLFLTGGRRSLTRSPVAGLKGTAQHAAFGVGKGDGRVHPTVLYDRLRNLRGKSRGSVCVLHSTQLRYKQLLKVYKYIIYNYFFF